MKCLNIGSGQRPFYTTGDHVWINVDRQAKWNPDVVWDCTDLSIFESDTVDVIVLHQVLEHAECSKGAAMLHECRRVLRSGGSVIVSVPNIEELAKMFLRGQITHETYIISVYGAYMGDEADFHKFGYTPLTLAESLYRAGFSRVETFDWRKIPGADIARDTWILTEEARK